MDVAIDEIFSNIAHYAYTPETGPATVRVEVEENPLSVVITFMDHGIPYDPLAEERPDTTKLSASERPIGGLGLFIVKKTMDDVSYGYFGIIYQWIKYGFDETPEEIKKRIDGAILSAVSSGKSE